MVAGCFQRIKENVFKKKEILLLFSIALFYILNALLVVNINCVYRNMSWIAIFVLFYTETTFASILH